MIQLINGDCRDFLPIEADVCITDPPYGVDRDGNMLGHIATNYHGKGTHTRGYHDHDAARFKELLLPAFDGIYKSLPKGATMFAFCGNRTFAQMVHMAEQAGFQMLDIVVFRGGGSFAKSTSMLSPKHELAMYMRKPGGVRNINPDRKITNFWEIPKTKAESGHPTTKPQSWMGRVVDVFSQPGDVVLDPFMGSGSTLVAAQSLGRSGVGIELDSGFFEMAQQRLGQGG